MKISFWTKLALSCLIVCTVSAWGMSVIISDMPQKTVMAGLGSRGGKTLILDAGHGGADGGAVSLTGTYESRINLDIALKVRALAVFYGIDPVMTRESEDISYPDGANTIRAKKVADTKARESLIKQTEDAILISIHQNKYTTSGPSGSQIFFAPTEGSRELAENIQPLLAQISGSNKRGVVQISRDVYLMNHIECPGVLIECGFVSNPAEARLLEDTEYQLKLASALIGGFIQSAG